MSLADNDISYCSTAADQIARMSDLGTGMRLLAFDLDRFPPGTGNAVGVNPQGYHDHYVEGALANSEFRAHCEKYNVTAASKPTGLFNTVATVPATGGTSSLRPTPRNGLIS